MDLSVDILVKVQFMLKTMLSLKDKGKKIA